MRRDFDLEEEEIDYSRGTSRKSRGDKSRSSRVPPGTSVKPYFLDKRVLITGSSSGIGRCLAYWFLNNGARVGLVGRDKESLTDIGRDFPSQAIVIHWDLADDKQQYEMAGGVIEKFGGLDILVNWAGAIFEGDVERTFPQDFDYLCDINLRLPFHLISLFQPFLEKSGGWIINLSCINGHRPTQGLISYAMSKAGLEMLTKWAALELAPLGIRVNAVAPSLCDTNLFRYSGLTETEFYAMKSRAKDTNPMHRVALPEEVAKAIVFLASDRAKRITGHILKVDGGKSLTNQSTVDWYGTDVMNRRFEAPKGGVSKISNFWKKIKTGLLDATQGAPVGSTDWINAHQKSNWATHDAEAHEKVDLDYGAYRIDADKNIEYERANLRGGANYPAKAQYRTYDRYTYGGARSGGGMGDPRGSAGRRTHF